MQRLEGHAGAPVCRQDHFFNWELTAALSYCEDFLAYDLINTKRLDLTGNTPIGSKVVAPGPTALQLCSSFPYIPAQILSSVCRWLEPAVAYDLLLHRE